MKQSANIPSDLLNFKKLEINLVEMLNKIAASSTSDQDVLDVNWVDSVGDTVVYKYPTVGSVRKDVDSVRKSMESIINNDGNKLELEYTDGTVRQFKTNRQFKVMETFDEFGQSPLNISNYFRAKNNWFFESFLNPLLYINIDISTYVANINTTKFSVKRVILNNLTSDQIDYFNTTINQRNTWKLDELTDDLNSRSIDFFIDDNVYDLPPIVNRYSGAFTVINIVQETTIVDGVNIKKNYYRLDTLQYSDILNNKNTTRILTEGDTLITQNDTEYVIESVDIKTKRVLLTKMFGSDSIAVGVNVLRIKPERYKVPYLQVNIGYNEREVVFIKPIDVDNNITTEQWSLGYPIYTNELLIKLNDNTELPLTDYYQQFVTDFGMLIMNLAKDRTIPTIVGLKPDSPVLDSNNFKIIIINQHLKSSPKIKEVKQKYAIKDRLQSEIASIDKSIESNKSELSRPDINKSEQTRINKKINESNDQKIMKEKQYESTVREINLGIKDNPEITIKNKYRIRGFWEIPEPKPSEYGNQEVIGFITSSRYLNSSGLGKNPDEIAFKDQNSKNIGYYSEWTEVRSKIRPKSYDEDTGVYVWDPEEVKNPDVVNSNQIQIPITKGELVEIKIRSISEAGWPNNPIMSDWSNIVTISFPTNIQDTESTEDMVADILTDNATLKTREYLITMGLDRHLKTSVTVADKTFSHSGDDVTTSQVDEDTKKILTLNESLQSINTKLVVLENAVSTDTGKLKVTFINDENTVNVSNGDTVSVFAGYYKDIIENTAGFTDGLVVSKAYTIVLENVSKTPLELVARMAGGIDQVIPDVNNYDEDFKNNRIYNKTPQIISSIIDSDRGDYKHESPFQTAHVQSEFIFTRYKDYGLSKALYSFHGTYTPTGDYNFLGITINSVTVPYSGYGNYLPYLPSFAQGGNNQDIWDGTYDGSNVPVGNGGLSEFCIHKDHPSINNLQTTDTFENTVRPPFIDDKQQYYPFAHSLHFEISENEKTNAFGADYYEQCEYNRPLDADGTGFADAYYPIKMGYITGDEYLIGKYTCGSYLFISPYNYTDISVEGNHPSLAKKTIEFGTNNVINIPIMYQFRCTDRLGNVGGFRLSETLSNIKYNKTIGVDIYLRGNNPISYGEVFSFDVNVSCQYKSGLNVIDPAYTPARGQVKNLTFIA